MERFNPWIVGAAASITFSIVFALCALAVALFPEATVGFFNAWFHGLDLTLLRPPGGRPLTLGQFVYGLVGMALFSFLTGALFAAVFNILRARR